MQREVQVKRESSSLWCVAGGWLGLGLAPAFNNVRCRKHAVPVVVSLSLSSSLSFLPPSSSSCTDPRAAPLSRLVQLHPPADKSQALTSAGPQLLQSVLILPACSSSTHTHTRKRWVDASPLAPAGFHDVLVGRAAAFRFIFWDACSNNPASTR